jgi:hypothetical protein
MQSCQPQADDAMNTGLNALAAILGCHQLLLWRVHLQLPARHARVQFESASSPVWAGRSETCCGCQRVGVI